MALGIAFLILGIWQLWMTKRSFTSLKKTSDEKTSPFIMISLGSSLVMAVIFLAIAINLVTGNFQF